MSDSLFKHFGEQNHDAHRGNLYWSGALGNLPFRGPYAPTLTRDELETQVKVTKDYHCDIFDLSNPEHHARFEWIMERIINGWFQGIHVQRQLVPEQKTVIVYLEWAQRYGELSPAARAARKQGHVQPIPEPPFPTTQFGGGKLAGIQDASNPF